MDTGWFRHSNTDERALRAAAELMSRGARAHELHQALFLRESPARIRLLGVALDTLELLARGRLAVMSLSQDSFAVAGAGAGDTEDILNEPMRIDSVVVSAMLVEQGNGLIRVSFRTKPPLEEGAPDIDAAGIAKSFGGGGHRRAAAARIDGSLADVRGTVIERIQQALPD
jgi:phosphoesterase RecJ-like protein